MSYSLRGSGLEMGQNQSEVLSSSRQEPKQSHSEEKSKGITVVHSKSNQSGSTSRSTELQKLENLPRFWPILRSTLEFEHPLESFDSGIKHEKLLPVCFRYQQHLSICAETVSNEQRSLTHRMKDLEMFSAGIAQQLMKRHDKINRLLPQLKRVTELSKTLVEIQKHLNDCVPLVNRINMYLPEDERLEYFSLNPNVSPRKASVAALRPTGRDTSRVQEPLEEDLTEYDET